MINSKIYNVIGVMSGTSMDGIDISLIKTDGINYNKIIYEKNYKYSENYKKKLKKLIKNLPKTKNKQILYSKKNEKFITNKFLVYIKKFVQITKYNKHKINLIGLSGQTIFHDPIKKYSIQLGSGKIINKKIQIPVFTNFRQKDLINGGVGAPIGSFYHKSILNKIKKNACIINLGGISNITYANKKNLISYDMGPANALVDDLSYYFYKKNFDRNGFCAFKGNLIKNIFDKFNQNIYFKKQYPKSLDRNYFSFFFKELIKYEANDAIHTASLMAISSILSGLKLLKHRIELVILTGGGRKNLFIKKKLKKFLKQQNINIINIDKYGFDGDMVEAQMFGYLAVRSLKKLPLSIPSTTGVKKAISGGIKFGKLTIN